MAQENHFEIMRQALKPKGTSKLIRLHMTGYFPEEFVNSVIDELQSKFSMVAAGVESVSQTDRLVVEVLKESAGIE